MLWRRAAEAADRHRCMSRQARPRALRRVARKPSAPDTAVGFVQELSPKALSASEKSYQQLVVAFINMFFDAFQLRVSAVTRWFVTENVGKRQASVTLLSLFRKRKSKRLDRQKLSANGDLWRFVGKSLYFYTLK